MTKETLINRIIEETLYPDNSDTMKQVLDEFFDSHVCIPKRENRHTHADIIHAYAEGAEIQYKGINDMWSSPCTDFPKGLTYRIKPSEPVYEYQWYYVDEGIAKIHPEFMTHGEVTDFRLSFIIEETKRVRQ